MPKSAPPTHYELLGLDPAATPEAIKRAWRERVSEQHPDRARGSRDEVLRTRATAELNAAYTVLTDPVARADYDLALARSRLKPPPTPPTPESTPTAAPPRPRPTTTRRPPPQTPRSRPERLVGLVGWLLRDGGGQWAALGLLLLGCLASLPFGNGLGSALGSFAGLAVYLLAAQSIAVRRLQGPSAAALFLVTLLFSLIFRIGGDNDGKKRRD